MTVVLANGHLTFNSRDALSVWDKLGQTMFRSSGSVSCSSSGTKMSTREIIHPSV